MNEEMKLSELKATDFEPYIHLDHAYRMDPPPFLYRYFDELIIKEIWRVKYKTLAKVAELKSQIIIAEGKMYSEIDQILAKTKG